MASLWRNLTKIHGTPGSQASARYETRQAKLKRLHHFRKAARCVMSQANSTFAASDRKPSNCSLCFKLAEAPDGNSPATDIILPRESTLTLCPLCALFCRKTDPDMKELHVPGELVSSIVETRRVLGYDLPQTVLQGPQSIVTRRSCGTDGIRLIPLRGA